MNSGFNILFTVTRYDDQHFVPEGSNEEKRNDFRAAKKICNLFLNNSMVGIHIQQLSIVYNMSILFQGLEI